MILFKRQSIALISFPLIIFHQPPTTWQKFERAVLAHLYLFKVNRRAEGLDSTIWCITQVFPLAPHLHFRVILPAHFHFCPSTHTLIRSTYHDSYYPRSYMLHWAAKNNHSKQCQTNHTELQLWSGLCQETEQNDNLNNSIISFESKGVQVESNMSKKAVNKSEEIGKTLQLKTKELCSNQIINNFMHKVLTD